MFTDSEETLAHTYIHIKSTVHIKKKKKRQLKQAKENIVLIDI